MEIREPLRPDRATAPRPPSADGARRDLQGLPALDRDDPPGPLQARLLLRALPLQPVRQDMLLGLRRRPPFAPPFVQGARHLSSTSRAGS